jgi:hypothetical protein
MTTMLTLSKLMVQAESLVNDYDRRTANLTHEKKGIRRSEMFFLYAAVAGLKPTRILESGRARAQSTLVLGLCFPNARITSIERDENSPDIPFALERLGSLGNIECIFGDSRVLLPEMLQPGDIVLIDGPKEFRALKLAFKLLRTGRPRAVFIRDLTQGKHERAFLDRRVPRAFFSDQPEFVRRYSYLDGKSVVSAAEIEKGYGATLACIPGGPLNYHSLLLQIAVARVVVRTPEIIRKFVSKIRHLLLAIAQTCHRDLERKIPK